MDLENISFLPAFLAAAHIQLSNKTSSVIWLKVTER